MIVEIQFISRNASLLNYPPARLASFFSFTTLHYPADYPRKRVSNVLSLSFSLSLSLSFLFYHHCQSFLKSGQLGTVLSKPQMAFECKPHEMHESSRVEDARMQLPKDETAKSCSGNNPLRSYFVIPLPLPPSLSLSLALSLQFGAMSYQKWSRESREMPALLRSLEQFINNVSECVSECICPTHALDECRAVFI